MSFPPLVHYRTVREYRAHYERIYCCGPIKTFDNIRVRFRKAWFDHCFFESTHRNKKKDHFSKMRSERIDWIKATLQDPNAELYVGWDSERKRYDKSRRVAVVVQDYVVVIRLIGHDKAQFVTAYVADSMSTIDRIRSSPKWGVVGK